MTGVETQLGHARLEVAALSPTVAAESGSQSQITRNSVNSLRLRLVPLEFALNPVNFIDLRLM